LISTGRVFIFGSCVTRDAFEIVPNSYKLVGYIARSSFASAFEHVPFASSVDFIDPDKRISSSWQREMVRIDVMKEAEQRLCRACSENDVILVDFIDERFDLFSIGKGRATGSSAFASVFNTSIASRISSGSDEHFELWRSGFERFLKVAQKLKCAVIVNAVRVSHSSETAILFDESLVQRQNERLSRFYKEAELGGYCRVFYNPGTALCDPNHKWGAAPFHYTTRYYEHFIDYLDSEVEMKRG